MINNMFIYNRRELMALQSENLVLEKQLHSYQQSLSRHPSLERKSRDDSPIPIQNDMKPTPDRRDSRRESRDTQHSRHSSERSNDKSYERSNDKSNERKGTRNNHVDTRSNDKSNEKNERHKERPYRYT